MTEPQLWMLGGFAAGFALGVFVGAWLEYRSWNRIKELEDFLDAVDSESGSKP